ncbi:MAG: type I 3-dehydroquinate dehydratase [Candidatus Bathyarchaeia archaeon]
MKIRICASIPVRSIQEALREAEAALSRGASLIEFRLDYAGEPLDLEALASGVPGGIPKIATLRPDWEGGRYRGSEGSRLRILVEAAGKGFEYVDLEAKTRGAGEVSERIRRNGGMVIASFHDYTDTPREEELKAILRLETGIGDLYKVATTARSYRDNLRILALQGDIRDGKGICFAMGPYGVPSRILSPLLGAPFTYASPSKELKVAPGQVAVEDLIQIYRLLGVWSD